MSTRCVIKFHWGRDESPAAMVYRHSDGYPDGEHGVAASLQRFFKTVQEQTCDTRFSDPPYLAAKFVVWQAGEYAGKGGPLDFLSVGVVMEEPGDIEYIYHVWCESSEVPRVTWEGLRD